MTRYKRMLLGATAATALIAMAPAAYAFEEVDWTWDANIDQNVTIDIDIDSTITPSGAIQIEKLQMHFGDLSSSSVVDGVYNNASVGEGTGTGTVIIDETFSFDTETDDSVIPSAVVPVVGTDDGDSDLTASLTGGSLDESTDQLLLSVNVQGEVPVENVIVDGVLEAVDLPKVENSATSVGNNQSIESNVPIYLHDAQFAAGSFNPTCGSGDGGDCPDEIGFLVGAFGVTELDGQLEDVNEHTSIAGLLTVAAATGFIEPAAITANASVSNVLNAYVQNSATAVTNNASFEVASDDPDNHYVVADLTQWGYANLTATANVNGVTIDGYTGFGAAGLGGGGDDITPIVSSSATAVGNNLSIKVGVPDVDG